MASRNEVLTLFGATPEQIMEKQRREQAAMILQQQDPFARAGSAIGVGLARLFGGKSADVIEAERLQGTRQGLDLSSIEGMREAAKRLQEAGFEDRALQLIDMADRRQTAEDARSLAGKKIVNKTVSRTVSVYDPVAGENKDVVVKIPIPHEYDMKTKTTTPIFSEEEIMAEATAQAPTTVTDTTETPESRARAKLLDQIDRIPVGGVENINGRYIRRFGPGPNDIAELTLEEVRQLPTELGNMGAITP